MAADLAKLARKFAGTIQRILNATICTGVGIAAVVSPDPDVILVGHGLGQTSLITEPFPVGIGKRKPRCWLDVQFRLRLDEPGEYLAVVASFFGIYANDPKRSCLCHFDYERDKGGGYPEAHLQVYGKSVALSAWGDSGSRGRQLQRLHFPVGGRRFRPILEDVIEFLIAEKLAEPRARWADALGRERANYQRLFRSRIPHPPQHRIQPECRTLPEPVSHIWA